MRYYKQLNDGYILSVGIGLGGEKITESEYNEIMTVIHNKPQETETTGYQLKEDLTWEPYDIEPTPQEDTQPTDEERLDAYDILMGLKE